jgi:hypothetical protein
VSAILAVALVLLVMAFATKGEEPTTVRRAGLVRVFPVSGTVALRQEAIGAELEFGYEGRIRIDRIDIPDDQLDVIQGINRVSFTPGEGKEISTLDEGRHCVSVFFWPTSSGDASPSQHTWCFTSA